MRTTPGHTGVYFRFGVNRSRRLALAQGSCVEQSRPRQCQAPFALNLKHTRHTEDFDPALGGLIANEGLWTEDHFHMGRSIQ
jgi:hypothetical protein